MNLGDTAGVPHLQIWHRCLQQLQPVLRLPPQPSLLPEQPVCTDPSRCRQAQSTPPTLTLSFLLSWVRMQAISMCTTSVRSARVRSATTSPCWTSASLCPTLSQAVSMRSKPIQSKTGAACVKRPVQAQVHQSEGCEGEARCGGSALGGVQRERAHRHDGCNPWLNDALHRLSNNCAACQAVLAHMYRNKWQGYLAHR